jgi:hypothetical protein
MTKSSNFNCIFAEEHYVIWFQTVQDGGGLNLKVKYSLEAQQEMNLRLLYSRMWGAVVS